MGMRHEEFHAQMARYGLLNKVDYFLQPTIRLGINRRQHGFRLVVYVSSTYEFFARSRGKAFKKFKLWYEA